MAGLKIYGGRKRSKRTKLKIPIRRKGKKKSIVARIFRWW